MIDFENTEAEISFVESEADALNILSAYIHGNNVKAGWWTDLTTGEDLRGYKTGYEAHPANAKRDVLNLLMLVVTEIAEAAEGVRKNLPDDKLPHRSMFEVELADALIRIFDIAGAHNLDLAGAVSEKLLFNKTRPDHQLENRLKDDGKKL